MPNSTLNFFLQGYLEKQAAPITWNGQLTSNDLIPNSVLNRFAAVAPSKPRPTNAINKAYQTPMQNRLINQQIQVNPQYRSDLNPGLFTRFSRAVASPFQSASTKARNAASDFRELNNSEFMTTTNPTANLALNARGKIPMNQRMAEADTQIAAAREADPNTHRVVGPSVGKPTTPAASGYLMRNGQKHTVAKLDRMPLKQRVGESAQAAPAPEPPAAPMTFPQLLRAREAAKIRSNQDMVLRREAYNTWRMRDPQRVTTQG